jgi:hypothetical protein
MQSIIKDVVKTFTIEIAPAASATATTWVFPDIPFLRNKKCYAIEASICANSAASGKINFFGSSTLVNPAFLTLVNKDNEEFVQNMPIANLRNTENFNQPGDFISYNTNGITPFKPRIVQWTKSNVFFPTATGVPNLSIQFIIYYI